jgi:carboxylate-amine ligase
MARFKAFVENEYPTVGVEQEFHLVDPHSGVLRPALEPVLDRLTGEVRRRVARELKKCVIEGQSPVCETMGELQEGVRQLRRELAEACRGAGVRLAAAGCHPISNWDEQPYVDDEHYRWVARETGYLTERMMAFGLHVHVGMRRPEAALYALHEFKRWTFPLLALSANSPFFEGRDTGLSSTRMHLFSSLPRTGLGPSVESMRELEVIFGRLHRSGDVKVPGDLWWLLRPQPPLGTVEVRVYDLPTDPQRVVVLSAITQAAMAFYQDRHFQGAPRSEFSADYLAENRWKAMRYGLDTKLIEPATGEVLEMREQIRRLLEIIAPKAEELGSLPWVERAEDILEEGNEATRQREFIGGGEPDLEGLELDIARRSVP